MFRAAILLVFFMASALMKADMNAQELDVWIGTSGAKASKGIYHCLLDSNSGKLGESRLVAEVSGPGFLAMHPLRSHLYAVGTLDGVPSVISYAIKSTGERASLELVNSVAVGDGGAAHVSVDPTGKTLLSAQYGGGSVAAYALNGDASIARQTQLIKHEGGSGVVPGRQDAPHAHWTGFSPDNRFAFVPDLGMDKVVIYRLNAVEARIEPHGFGVVPPGAGPRHMKFHPNGRWIYVLNELALSVSVFDYDADKGTMTIKQTLPTVSQAELDKQKFKSCSEIRVRPDGRFVYAANRGHDTITVFSVGDDGRLAFVQNEQIRGATPRNFNLDPSAKWLVAGGQDSHTLACFEVNRETGEITYNQSIISTPAPICVLFGPE